MKLPPAFPVRLPDFDDLTTEQLLELAVGRLERMDSLSLALFSRLVELHAENKRLRSVFTDDEANPA